MIGLKFGRLTVVNFHSKIKYKTKWNCICECGNIHTVEQNSLKRGTTKSCGCLHKEQVALMGKAKKVHGMINSSEYGSWQAMKYRCLNKNNPRYPEYGGNSINICKAWLDSFEIFFKDMGLKPTKEHSIDRIDNNANYSCGKCEQCIKNQWTMNCRWATKIEQANNQKSNVKVINTETNEIFDTIVNAAKSVGIKKGILYHQLKGTTRNKTKLKLLI